MQPSSSDTDSDTEPAVDGKDEVERQEDSRRDGDLESREEFYERIGDELEQSLRSD